MSDSRYCRLVSLDDIKARCCIDEGHWIWLGALSENGVPRVHTMGKKTYVTRYVYGHLLGRRLRPKHVVKSKCEVDLCVSPKCLVQIPKTVQCRRIADNHKHRYMARVSKLRQNGATKLDFEKAKEIRRLYATGFWTKAQLGRKYGVGQHAIRMCVLGKSWRAPTVATSVFAWAQSMEVQHEEDALV